MDQYKSTSKSLTILSIFVPSIYFYYLADVLANEKYFSSRPRRDTSVNKENILRYLAQDKQNHVQGKIAIIVSVILYFMSSHYMVSFFEYKFKNRISAVNKQFSMELNEHISVLD